MTIYISMRGEQSGPYALSQIESMWHNGILTQDALYCKDGQNEWRNVSELIFSEGQKSESTAASASFQAITKRVQRLERGNRFLFAGLIVTVILAIFVRRGGNESGNAVSPPMGAGQDFVLRDSAGTVRWKVAVDDNGAIAESFFDNAGKERVSLGVDAENTARERLYDTDGSIRVGAFAYAFTGNTNYPGQAGFAINAPRKNGKAVLSSILLDSYPNQDVGIQLLDAGGFDRLELNALANGGANERLCDAEGRLRMATYTDDKNNAVQMFLDASGKDRDFTETSLDGVCQTVLCDTQENIRLSSATLGDGSVAQNLMNAGGNLEFSFAVDADGNPSHFIDDSAIVKAWNTVQTIKDGYDTLKWIHDMMQSNDH